MITKGTSLTYGLTGDVHALFYETTQDLRGDVSGQLAQYFDVSGLTVTPHGLVLTGTMDWSYTAQVTVRTQRDYGSEADIRSVVAHAFWEAAGAAPEIELVRASDAGLRVGQAPPSGVGSDEQPHVPWSNTILFAAVAL